MLRISDTYIRYIFKDTWPNSLQLFSYKTTAFVN